MSERLAIEAECTRLINFFSWCIDTRSFEEGAAIFAPEGAFGHMGSDFIGPEGVLEMLKSRPEGGKGAHIFTNILIDVADEDHAKGKAWSVIYLHNGPFDPSAPEPLNPITIRRFDTGFRRTEDGWRVTSWRSSPDFREG